LLAISQYKGSKKKAKKKLRASFHVGFVDKMEMILKRADLDVEDKKYA
jgi:hypothetical protein